MHWCSYYSNYRTECLWLLIEAKVNVNQSGHHGFTGARYACQDGNIECLRLLTESKADVELKNAHLDTALILTALGGHPECLKVMIEAKADVNQALD